MMWWCFIVDCVSWQILNVMRNTSVLSPLLLLMMIEQPFKGANILHWQLSDMFAAAAAAAACLFVFSSFFFSRSKYVRTRYMYVDR